MVNLGSARSETNHVQARFRLMDHDGVLVTESTYRGKYLLVFFGFTHCKMVCPRALGRLSRVLERLGQAADRIEPLYITVDPERDTPEVMKAFLFQNYSRFTGLTGSTGDIDAAKQSFRVFAKKTSDPDDPQAYQMPHSAFTYLFDENGEYLMHFTDAAEEDELVRRLLPVLQ
jgi:protein SCO1